MRPLVNTFRESSNAYYLKNLAFCVISCYVNSEINKKAGVAVSDISDVLKKRRQALGLTLSQIAAETDKTSTYCGVFLHTLPPSEEEGLVIQDRVSQIKNTLQDHARGCGLTFRG